MEMKETLNNLCYDERGGLKEKNECRAAMINHLILEDGLDIDAAEDTADKFIRECGIWPMPKFDWEEDEPAKTEST
jgi:hypothetical protein